MKSYKHYKRNGTDTMLHRHIIEEHLGRKLETNEVVHHINGNKFDNRIENLIVMSRSEHSRLHAIKEPLLKKCLICGNEYNRLSKNGCTALVCSRECLYLMRSKISRTRKGKKIKRFSLDGNYIDSWKSLGEIQRKYGFAKSNIVSCCNGKYKSAYGYIWRFANE